ncbi:MAG: hypothetical protein J6A52_00640 [Bacilli bacterium]|nr:hypothetical protein [Bacilli bacterium]
MKYTLKSTKGMQINHPPILGHGAQGTVFKIGNSAVKLFNGYWFTVKNRPDDLEVAKRMTSLELSHFLKPTRLIVNKNGLKGVETPIIKRDKKKKFIDMKIDKIVKNMKAIRKDATTLSDNGIKLNDFNYDSVYISGDNITIGDFSYFMIDDEQDLHKSNNSAINALFATDMIYGDYNYKNTMILYEIFWSQMRDRHFEDVLEEISSKGHKTIRQYVKSLHR